MTEQEWLTATDPTPMLDHVRQGLKQALLEFAHWVGLSKQTRWERKLRLFACACMRHVWDKLENAVQNATEITERYADGLATRRELALAGEKHGVQGVIAPTLKFAADAAIHSAHEAARLIGSNNLDDPRRIAVLAELSGVLRDIMGNPFHPAVLDGRWLTSTVVDLAQAIYEERAFERMPILADALMDAGCDNEAMIAHCRDAAGVHARGCWVVDLLLGKE